MQKRALKRTKNFGSVILYRNDIEELLQLLSKSVFVVRLKDDEYEYDNLDEMQKHRGDFVRRFIIEAKGNFAELELQFSGRLGSKLESDDDTTFLTTLDFLRKRQRSVLYYGLLALAILVLALMFVAAHFNKEKTTFGLGCVWAVSVLLFLWCHTGIFSRVHFTTKTETPSFWKRNNDTIWIAIVSALFGGLITWVVTYLTSK